MALAACAVQDSAPNQEESTISAVTAPLPSFYVKAGKSINLPFTLTGPDGQPDVTTTAHIFSECDDDVHVGFVDGRTAFADGLEVGAGVKVTIYAAIGGVWFYQIFKVVVVADTATTQAGMGTPGPASAEYTTSVR